MTHSSSRRESWCTYWQLPRSCLSQQPGSLAPWLLAEGDAFARVHVFSRLEFTPRNACSFLISTTSRVDTQPPPKSPDRSFILCTVSQPNHTDDDRGSGAVDGTQLTPAQLCGQSPALMGFNLRSLIISSGASLLPFALLVLLCAEVGFCGTCGLAEESKRLRGSVEL